MKWQMRTLNALTGITAVIAVLALGCGSTQRVREIQSQDSVGKISVGVQSIAPFDDAYVRQISPNFTLTTPDALQAISQARIRELETLREVLLAARLDLGARGTSVTKATEAATGAETTVKETTTETKTPGTAPATQLPAAIAATLARLTDDETVTIDAALRYRTAASLIQEVALLNRYVRDAAIARNTAPYVVRFLVTVSPYSRELPYDASVSIELTDSNKKPIVVVPLFVTDTIETSREGSFARAASAVGGDVGGVLGTGIGVSL
ncbi:MAG TPA: hypothetical protein VFO89_00355, partial [Thermoanaerobaculia bacterium]|nr:hypothetical protein [Thermoanaerobaculia bacterium]